MGKRLKVNPGKRHLSFGWKVGLTVLVPILFFVIAIFFNNINLFKVSENIDEVESKGALSIEVTELGSLFSSKYIQISEYVILQLQQKINQYQMISREFESSIAHIREQINQEEHLALLDKIINNNQKMDQLFEEEIIPNVKANRLEEAIKVMESASGLRSVTLENTRKLQELLRIQREDSVANAKSYLADSLQLLLVSTLIAIAAGGLITFLIFRRVNRNLKQVVNISNQIAEGNLAVEKLKAPSRDEIGQLYDSVNVMSGNLQQMTRQILDVTHSIRAQSEELTRSMNELKLGSEQIVLTMEQLSVGTEDQARSASEIVHLIEHFNQQIMEANQESNEMEASSGEVLQSAESGRSQMASFVEQMSRINDIVLDSVEKVKLLDHKTQNITSFTDVIKEIADQTNLLALNAAIEAARAGEAGSGFSVVANEVRKLAERTNEYVAKISEIIDGIRDESKEVVESLHQGYNEVTEGTSKIKEVGNSFATIYNAVADTVERIRSSSARMELIAERSKEINYLIEQIASVSEETAAGVEETSASAEQQNKAIENINQNLIHLNKLAEDLRLSIEKFKV